MPSRNTNGSRRRSPPAARPKRTLTFKFKLTPEEQGTIRLRARGYPTPAHYARTTLLAGWSLPVDRIRRVVDAFLPIQDVIDRLHQHGGVVEAERATGALRQIVAAIGEPW